MATPGFIKAPVALVNNLILPHPRAEKVDMHGKVILVTGVTPGSIGFETAKVLKQWGAQVVATVRGEESRRDCIERFRTVSGEHDIDVQCMDLADFNSVKSFCDYFKSSYQNLDVLLNNAGVYLDMAGNWKSEKLSDDAEEIHWRINYLGSAQLTLALFPLLEDSAMKAGEARAIFVSSHMHDNCVNEEMFSGLKPYKSVKAYGRSKLASMHFSRYLHERYHESTQIKFVSLHPGSIYTNLADKGFDENPLLNKLRKTFAGLEKAILLNPEEGAQTQIKCATDPDIESGVYYRRCERDQYSPELDKQEDSEKLWFQTIEWLTQREPALGAFRGNS